MKKISKIITNLMLAFRDGGVRNFLILFANYANNSLGGCGLKIEMLYKLHHLVCRFKYKIFDVRVVENSFNLEKFSKEAYVIFEPIYSSELLSSVLNKCKVEMYNKDNISKIANKFNKPFNGFVSENVPSEYYSKQVQWLNNPSSAVQELLQLFGNPFIDRVLKSIFRSNYVVENIAMYETRNNEHKETFNLNSRFHTDNNPSTSLKMMIYLCDVDQNNGPFLVQEMHTGKVISVIGRAGTVAIFKSHSLLHAAKNTLSGSRFAVFYTLVPSLKPWNGVVSCDRWLNVPYRKNPFLKIGE